MDTGTFIYDESMYSCHNKIIRSLLTAGDGIGHCNSDSEMLETIWETEIIF